MTLNSVFSSSHGSSGAAAGGGSGHCGGAHAELLFDGFHQVVEFQDRHAVQRGQECVFIECHFGFLTIGLNVFKRKRLKRPAASAARFCAGASPPPRFSASAARTRAVREIGDCIKPSNCASSTSLEGMLASCFTPFDVQGLATECAAANHQLVVGLREIGHHFRGGHGVFGEAIDQRTGHLVGRRLRTRYPRQHGVPACSSTR